MVIVLATLCFHGHSPDETRLAGQPG